MSTITITAPDGIGEVRAGTDLAAAVADAVELADGDIVVVTSKIVSKAEGRWFPLAERDRLIDAEMVATVARRGELRIVRTRTGLVQAAAGVDASNVGAADRGASLERSVLALPLDPDASARALWLALRARTGRRLGVLISDTAGRAWRIGQTDHVIGSAGVRLVERYAGRTDADGVLLHVTETAVGDELAAAADLVKRKLARRPVAVVRGLGELLDDDAPGAAELVRPAGADLFRHGSREAVLAAVLVATGQPERFEDLVGQDGDDLIAAVLAGCPAGTHDLIARLLRAAAGS